MELPCMMLMYDKTTIIFHIDSFASDSLFVFNFTITHEILLPQKGRFFHLITEVPV